MKKTFRYLVSLLLAVCLLPGFSMIAFAAVQPGQLTINNETVTAIGISGEADNYNITNNSYQIMATDKANTIPYVGTFYTSVTRTITFTNNYSGEIRITYSSLANGSFSYDGATDTDNVISMPSGSSFSIKVKSPGNRSSGGTTTATFTTTAIWYEPKTSEVNFVAPENGTFTVTDADGNAVELGSAASSTSFSLKATANTGYKFYRWVFTDSSGAKSYLGIKSDNLAHQADKPGTMTCEFIPADAAFYSVSGNEYAYLDEAITAAGTSKQIVVVESGTVYGSTRQTEFTIPNGVTLVLPYAAGQTLVQGSDMGSILGAMGTKFAYGNYAAKEGYKYEPGSLTYGKNVELVIPKDTTVTNKGIIAVGGTLYGNAAMYGPHSNLKVNGTLELNSSTSVLSAIGYVYGEGTVKATKDAGAKILQPLSMLRSDSWFWSVANIGAALSGGKGMETYPADGYNVGNPSPRYTTQAIQCRLEMASGNTMYGYCDQECSDTHYRANLILVGSNASESLIALHDGATLVSTYKSDETSSLYPNVGKQTLEITGNATQGTISIDASIYGEFSLGEIFFPIPYNYDIVLENGTFNLQYDLALLPGASLKIGAGATLNVPANVRLAAFSGAKDHSGFGVHSTSSSVSTTSYNSGDTVAPRYPVNSTLGTVSDGTMMANLVIDGGTLDVKQNAYLGGVVQTTGSGTIIMGGTPSRFTVQLGMTGKCNDMDGDIEYLSGATIYEFYPQYFDVDGNLQTMESGKTYKGASAEVNSIETFTFDLYTSSADVSLKESHTETINAKPVGRFSSECVHSWSAATCEAPATCSKCGATEGNALGHSWTAATCEAPKTCSVCKVTEGEALGHNMQLSTEKVEPQCEVPGKEAVYTCANNCGKTEGGEEIAALQHDMQLTAEKVEAKCEVPGKEAVYTCANGCGKTEGGAEIPATEHNWDEGVYTAPTFEADGFTTYTCQNDRSHTNVETHEGTKLTAVAQIGEEKFATLAEALKADGEVKLLADINLDEAVVAIGKTIDFNGHTVTGTLLGTIKLNGGLLVTAEGYRMIGVGADYYVSEDAVFSMDDNGNITIHSGTVTLAQSWWTQEGQTLTIEEGATFVIPAEVTLQVLSKVIVEGTATVEGTVNLYSAEATVQAPEGLNITTTAGDKVLYQNGVYTVHSHTEGEPIVEHKKDATCGAEGSYESVVKCSVCGDKLSSETVTVPATGDHSFTNYVYDGIEKGTATATCDNGCGAVHTREAALPNAVVTNLGYIRVDEYSVYNGSLTEGGEPIKLQVAMEFTANDTPEAAAENFFGNYTTDFFIKIERLAGDSFVADGCYLAGHYGSFGWIMIPLDGMTIEAGKFYPVITSVGHNFTYTDICTSVKDSKCGIYFSEEVIVQNPDIQVTLALGLSKDLNAAQNADFITVGVPYTYDVDDMQCTHKGGEPVVENKVDPDCDTAGSYDTVTYCTVCDAVISSEKTTVDALGHKEETVDGKDATCTETGLTEGKKCTVCGETTVEQTEIPATGHSYVEAGENAWTWSESEDGGYTATVTLACEKCDDTKTVNAEVTSEITQQPSETAVGKKIYTAKATFEGNEYTATKEVTIPMLAHTHKLAKVEAKAATCVENGNIEHYTCSGCGKLFTDAAGNEETSAEDVVVPTVDHKWNEGEQTKAPTATETGIMTYTCGTCGATKTEEIPMLEECSHEGGTATCKELAVCTQCGEAYGALDPNKHVNTTTVNAKDATCGEAGYTGDTYCNDCEKTVATGTTIPATGEHNYVGGICSGCGTEESKEPGDTIIPKITGKSLLLEGMVSVNIYVGFVDADGKNLEINYVLEHGGVEVTCVDGTVVDCEELKKDGIYNGIQEYTVVTPGIPAKDMDKYLILRPYVIIDNVKIYGESHEYGVLNYAENTIKKDSTDVKLKATIVGLLKYGAAAQEYFDSVKNNPYEKPDVLMDACLNTFVENGWMDENLLELNWDSTLLTALNEPSEDMIINFTQSAANFSCTGKSLMLNGAISINYYMSVGKDADTAKKFEGTTAKLYQWTGAEYEALKAEGKVLSKENATYITVVENIVLKDVGYGYECTVESGQIPAKEFGDTFYAVMCFADKDGNEYFTDMVTYSPESYATKYHTSTDTKLADLVKWMVTYGEYAKIYFTKK